MKISKIVKLGSPVISWWYSLDPLSTSIQRRTTSRRKKATGMYSNNKQIAVFAGVTKKLNLSPLIHFLG